jgi:hypothetical protein
MTNKQKTIAAQLAEEMRPMRPLPPISRLMQTYGVGNSSLVSIIESAQGLHQRWLLSHFAPLASDQ